MPGANNSNYVSWKMLTLLVAIMGGIVTTVFALSNTGDAKLEKTIEKMDTDKVDQTVYDQHIETEKERRIRQDAQWEKIDQKLDKALGLE